jgi:hypothetical protein
MEVLDRWTTRDRKPIHYSIRDIWIDVDGLDIGFDCLITSDPIALILRPETEGSAERKAEFQVA